MDHNGEHSPAARGQPGGPTPPGETLHPHEPRVIGPYRLLRRLGAGGMGTVYLSETAGRRVAVKIVRPDLAADEEFRRRFRQEVDAARRVAPFCTAEVLDADPDAAAPYLVTEFIDGVRLDHAVESGPISGSTLTGLAVGVATALTAIHTAGLVHRDLKPSNVLLSMSGPRVIDFGIAQALEGAKAKPTAWGFGSAGWMAPEQVNGQPIGPEADVFTWGILVAFAGTGRHPFGTGTDLELSTRIVSEEPDIVGLPPDLSPLVVAALAKDPDARPNARDLLLSLIALPALPHSRSLGGNDQTGRPGSTPVDQAEELLNLTRGTTLPGVAPTRMGPPTAVDGRRGSGQVGPVGRLDHRDQAGVGHSHQAGGQPPARQLLRAPAGPPNQAGPRVGPPGQVGPPGPGEPRGRDAGLGGPDPGVAVPSPAGAPPFSGAPAGAQPPRPGRIAGGWPAARPPGGPAPHGPGFAPPPPGGEPNQARSTRQRRVLFAAVALTAVVAAWLISAITRGDSSPDGPSGTPHSPASFLPAPSTPQTVKVGVPARDDQLEFTVNKVECGVKEIGEWILARDPGEGDQFCLVDVTVNNRGTIKRSLSTSSQNLVDSAGESHSADFLARFYPGLGDGIWNTIDPGTTVTGTFAFDIPLAVTAKRLELHERPESKGVIIEPLSAGQ